MTTASQEKEPSQLPFTVTLRLTHLCLLVGASAFLGGLGGAAFMWLITRCGY